MKLPLLFILAFSLPLLAQQLPQSRDIRIMQRDIENKNNMVRNLSFPPNGLNGVIGMNGTTLRPTVYILGNGFAITPGAPYGTLNVSGFLTSEVDGDPANELQTLSLMGGSLSISGGNSVPLGIPAALSQLTNDSGFITGITGAMVNAALGYTPLQAEVDGSTSNEIQTLSINSGSLTISSGNTVNLGIPTNTNQLTNGAGFLTSITGSMVSAALGFTPLQTEVDGSVSNELQTLSLVGSDLSISSGNTISLPAPTSAQIIAALGYTPYSSANPSAFMSQAGVRNAISLTTTGTGAATYNAGTGVLNIPTPNPSSGTVTSVGITSTDLTVSGSPVTTSGNITANLTNSGVTAGTYSGNHSLTVDAKGRATAVSLVPRVYTVPTFANATAATQLSTTRDAWVQYDANATVAISILSGQSITMILEYADNNGMTVNLVTLSQCITSNAGVLGLSQTNGLRVQGFVPAGKYRRVRFTSTGSPTLPSSFVGAQEVLQ